MSQSVIELGLSFLYIYMRSKRSGMNLVGEEEQYSGSKIWKGREANYESETP